MKAKYGYDDAVLFKPHLPLSHKGIKLENELIGFINYAEFGEVSKEWVYEIELYDYPEITVKVQEKNIIREMKWNDSKSRLE